MGAFDPIWSDVDRTSADTPYVVSADGWGWFAIFIILAIPFFIIGLIVTRFSQFLYQHPYLSICGYITISFILGNILYRRGRRKFKSIGVVATLITMLPFAMVEGLYLVPYIQQNSLFSAAFEWLIVTVFICVITFFVMVISNMLDNGLIHFVISVLFCCGTFFILNNIFSSSSEINWSVIQDIYNLK